MTLADEDAYSKVVGVDICLGEGVGDSLVTCEGMVTLGSDATFEC